MSIKIIYFSDFEYFFHFVGAFFVLMMAFVLIDVAACQPPQCSVKDRFPRFLYALDIFRCDYKTSAIFSPDPYSADIVCKQ